MGEEKVPRDQRGERWRTLVGPIFRAVWPLDAHLRSKRHSENLMRMALEAGDAFPDAVDAIVDVVVPFELYRLSLSLRLEKKHENLHREYPKAFLKLVNALVDPAFYRVPSDLGEVLQECLEADPSVVNELTYRRLYGLRRAGGA
jgi:hypothetical protein